MTTSTYNPVIMLSNLRDARRAVVNVNYALRLRWLNSNDMDEMERVSKQRQERAWLIREFDNYSMHPVIEAAVMLARPYDWQQLFLEWPHISQGDKSKIAYTQNEDKGKRDLQTVTSVGKYLRRHFPDLSDHAIRDLSALHGTADTYKFVHTTAEMIYHLERGPNSCMVWSEDRGVRCTDGVSRHPYEAYNPKYGWHMAVRLSGDDTVGRALCMNSPDHGKYFVRTYARAANTGYSQADNGMENWLRDQGYTKFTSWGNGEKLAYHETRDEFLAPYLDGSDKRVRVGDGCLVIDDEGKYICDQTGGVPTEEDDDCFDCEDCGDSTDDDDGYWVGYHDDGHVCEHCYENDYVYGYGRNGNQYSFRSEDAVYVDSQGEYYHEHYLDSNNIVELENGGHEHIDDAVEINGEWYHVDDERICRTTDTDEFMLTDDCWQCEESGNWYTEDTESVLIDGNQYHPDHAPEQDDADEDSDICVTLPPVVAVAPVAVEKVVVASELTIHMLNECALVEEYDALRQRVTYSLSIIYNGVRLQTERSYRDSFIASQGVDWMRMNVRRVLSNELLGLPQSSTETI